jgi:hypothetical protein
MYYIDDYNSKAVTNTPPQRQMVAKLKQANTENQKAQMNAFWNLMGITIAEKFEDIKEILSRYGYNVVNEEDAAVAISELWTTPKWLDFVKDASFLIEETVDEKLDNTILPKTEESSWVEAVIAAVGSIVGGSLSLASSNKQLKATKENAKATMITALAQVQVERQKVEAEKLRSEGATGKTAIWIVGITIACIAVIVAIVVYKKRKALNK